MRVFKCFKLDTLHKETVLSADPDAKYSPFGENAKLRIISLWPVRVFISFPIF